MSENKDKQLLLFEEKQVRHVWDSEAEKYWLSIVDVVSVLTDTDYQTARKYWKVLKGRLIEEGNEMVTNCYQLKLQAADGKNYLSDVADTEQILRLIQSIPSKKVEPLKMWLAQVGRERIDEMIDPEQSIDRAIQNYRRMGYSESWINERIKGIDVRKTLTDEWDKSGIKQGKEYAILTSIITKEWSGKTVKEYKEYKNLKKENLRDNMTTDEIALNTLAEAATATISKTKKPKGLYESMDVAKRGGNVAKVARLQLEKEIGRSVISSENAKIIEQIDIDMIDYEEFE